MSNERSSIANKLSFIFRWFISFVWSSINKWRRFFAKFSEPYSFGCTTLSIGNIQAGGTGKTPLTAYLANKKLEKTPNAIIFILTRGFQSEWERSGGIIEASDNVELSIPSVPHAGDEAVLLNLLSPKVWIGIGKNRIESYLRLLNQIGKKPDLIILDDGFQQFNIKKTKEILLLTDAKFGERYFREFYSATAQASLTVWTKSNFQRNALSCLKGVSTSGETFKISYKIQGLKINPQAVVLVSAIAEPIIFENEIRKLGYSILKHFIYPDHFSYSESEIEKILDFCKSNQSNLRTPILMTGKDWVKWRGFGRVYSNVYFAEPSVIFNSSEEEANFLSQCGID